MRRMPALSLTVSILLAATTSALARDENTAKTAQQVFDKYNRAVVHVSGVAKISVAGSMASIAGGDKEQKVQAVGTVIDPSGLTVTSLSRIDPASALGNVNVNVGGQMRTLSLSSTFSNLKIRLADGTELPATFILKDADLDLAFIAPDTKPDKETLEKFAATDLADAEGEGNLLDEIIILGRQGKTLNYVPTVAIGSISGIVAKPRKFYLGAARPGTPVFAANGKLLGIALTKGGGTRGTVSGNTMSFSAGAGAAVVVLPAADVEEVAEQARAEAAKSRGKTVDFGDGTLDFGGEKEEGEDSGT